MSELNKPKEINDFRLPPVDRNAHIFGAAPTLKGGVVTDGHWLKYLPELELQNKGFETFDCTGFGTQNPLEILFYRIYNDRRNFSDRWAGIIAGTDPKNGGNDPQTVIQAIHSKGEVPEGMLPFDDSVKTVEQFYSPKPPTPDLIAEGKKFLDLWKVGYEQVPSTPETIKEALKYSPLGASMKAWFEKDGLYYFPDGVEYNHWADIVDFEDGVCWYVFDSYEPFIKKVAWDSVFPYMLRYSIEPNNDLSLIQQILTIIGQILHIDSLLIEKKREAQRPEAVNPPLPIPPTPLPIPPTPLPVTHELTLPPFREATWTEIKEMQELTRKVCRDEFLTYTMANRLYKTVEGESGFNQLARHVNKNKSIDWGICQLNDRWYVGENHEVKTPYDALTNPELCLRVMARAFSNGRARDWNVYKSLYG